MVRKPSAFGLHVTTEVYTNKSWVVYLNSLHNCGQEIFSSHYFTGKLSNKKETRAIEKSLHRKYYCCLVAKSYLTLLRPHRL